MTTSSITSNDSNQLPADAQAVLQFWLGTPLNNAAALAQRALWFGKSDATDQAIAQRFTTVVQAARAGRLDHWVNTAEGALALLIALDQFTRNIWRGQADSFSGDAKALAVAQQALQQGLDAQVPSVARIFFYLPLEHAEDLDCQRHSVRLFAQLAVQADDVTREFLQGTEAYAHKHLDVIAQFGRFPHRNPILGRESTPEELHYLAQPGAGF